MLLDSFDVLVIFFCGLLSNLLRDLFVYSPDGKNEKKFRVFKSTNMEHLTVRIFSKRMNTETQKIMVHDKLNNVLTSFV